MKWQERQEIGNCLDYLVKNGYDEKKARKVIEGCQCFSKNTAFYASFWKKNKSNYCTGHTEIGNVTVEDEKEKTVKKEFGNIPKRVGNYKVCVTKNEIEFWYFWKSDIETEGLSEKPSVYSITYDKELNPVDFCVEKYSKNNSNLITSFLDKISIFTILVFSLGLIKVRIIFIYRESLFPGKKGERRYGGRNTLVKIGF